MNDTAPKANPEMLPPLPEPRIFGNYFTADEMRAVQQEAYRLGYSAARPKWTTGRPTQPGFYWARYRDFFRVVNIFAIDDELYVDNVGCPLAQLTEWAWSDTSLPEPINPDPQ